eukprot:GHVS01094321.1.p1 GENE.GHVS01094321.1~~GHVS01094321.1.p1  ORF type:complete len:486 (-),score=68.77 GHVS01094321.1:230-1687(-)
MASVGRLFARLLLSLPVALLLLPPAAAEVPQLPLSLFADGQIVGNEVPLGTTTLKLDAEWVFEGFPPVTHVSLGKWVYDESERKEEVDDKAIKDGVYTLLKAGWVAAFATIPMPKYNGKRTMAGVQVDLISSGVKKLSQHLGCESSPWVSVPVDIDERLWIIRALVKPLQKMHRAKIRYGEFDMDNILVVWPKEGSSGDTADTAADKVETGFPTSAALASPAAELKRPVQIMTEKTKLLLVGSDNAQFYIDKTEEAFEMAYNGICDILLFLSRFHSRGSNRLYTVLAKDASDVKRLALYSQIGVIDHGFGTDTEFKDMTESAKAMWKFVTRAVVTKREQSFNQMVEPLNNGDEFSEDDVQLLFDYAKAMYEDNSKWFEEYNEIIRNFSSDMDEYMSRKKRRDANIFYRAIGKFKEPVIAEQEEVLKALNVAFNFTYMFPPVKDRLPEQRVDFDFNSPIWKEIQEMNTDGIIWKKIKKKEDQKENP